MNRFRVLLTRPRPDSEALAAVLRSRGIDSLIEPLLRVVPRQDAPGLDLAGVQAVLLTSANGARALEAALGAAPAGRQMPLFVVGEATARAARAAQFASLQVANGTVAALAGLVAGALEPGAGALLHVAGSAVAGDLAGDLGGRGFALRRVVLYEAHTAKALTEAAQAALVEGTLDAALFFSPRTATTFVNLINQARLEPAARRIAAVCLSAAVAEAAGALDWRAIRIAAQPDQAALLDEVERECRARTSDR